MPGLKTRPTSAVWRPSLRSRSEDPAYVRDADLTTLIVRQSRPS